MASTARQDALAALPSTHPLESGDPAQNMSQPYDSCASEGLAPHAFVQPAPPSSSDRQSSETEQGERSGHPPHPPARLTDAGTTHSSSSGYACISTAQPTPLPRADAMNSASDLGIRSKRGSGDAVLPLESSGQKRSRRPPVAGASGRGAAGASNFSWGFLPPPRPGQTIESPGAAAAFTPDSTGTFPIERFPLVRDSELPYESPNVQVCSCFET